MADSNVPIQDKDLDALISFLRVTNVETVGSKCLTGRPKVAEKSQAVFLLWVNESVESTKKVSNRTPSKSGSRIAKSNSDFRDVYLQKHDNRSPNSSDFVKYFREDLHILLLSFDFKKQIDGLNLLLKSLPASAEEIIGLLDILLKWVVLRFCDANTACLLKVVFFTVHFPFPSGYINMVRAMIFLMNIL
ncbi:hypothetical protein Syun_027317 [Stephania yunnanensis]|uniref:Uncharacterized protein n=1 Tax=Stephania yunnanensis TaxID=152371 RepID=A0AAP0EFE7_9MAGN